MSRTRSNTDALFSGEVPGIQESAEMVRPATFSGNRRGYDEPESLEHRRIVFRRRIRESAQMVWQATFSGNRRGDDEPDSLEQRRTVFRRSSRYSGSSPDGLAGDFLRKLEQKGKIPPPFSKFSGAAPLRFFSRSSGF